ncbi:unnamed protein product, partial [Brenthis ino]
MCQCSRLTYCLGNIFYIFERLVSCCALTSVVTCLVATLIVMLALGIGLGYNYCFIDMETGRYKDDLLVKPVETHVTTSANGIIFVKPMVTTTTPLPIEVNSTMIAPLNIGINFTYLIQKIKEKKHNVTLELIY